MTDDRAAPHPLTGTHALWLALEALGIVAAFVALSVVAGEPATACGWCEPNGFDAVARDVLRWRDPRAAALYSHVLAVLVAPVLALGAVVVPALRARRYGHAVQDFVIMVNAFLLTTALTDFSKKIADRERPGFHHGLVAATEAAAYPVERFLSFFSGDTAWACVIVAAAATLRAQRGHPGARHVAVAGALVGAGTAVLRVAADMHWATDVMAGAAVGTAVGVALPRLFHRRAPTA